jgi:tetrahydromethanopterin S-methyltransferase subunit C
MVVDTRTLLLSIALGCICFLLQTLSFIQVLLLFAASAVGYAVWDFMQLDFAERRNKRLAMREKWAKVLPSNLISFSAENVFYVGPEQDFSDRQAV